MSVIYASCGPVGGPFGCKRCGAGYSNRFNWDFPQPYSRRKFPHDLRVFVEPVALRVGTLFRCQSCGQPWYRCGEPAMMNFVPGDRLDVVLRWNELEIVLPTAAASVLQTIGPTPPGLYGDGRRTPCAVTTIDGERIDRAVVVELGRAPFEWWGPSRLATEIAELRPSPDALPWAVRAATSLAEETRMGFSPTLVESPTGELMWLNCIQNFLDQPGWAAADVAVAARRPLDPDNWPPIYVGTKGVVAFIVDPYP